MLFMHYFIKLDWILVLCYLCIILLWLITFVGQCHNLFWGFGISLKNLNCQGIFLFSAFAIFYDFCLIF